MKALQKLNESGVMLRGIEYYFLRLPYYALWSPDRAYRKISTYAKGRTVKERQEKFVRHFKQVFGERWDDGTIEAYSRKYFEVLSSDDLDAWIRLVKPWREIKRHLRVEGSEYLRKVINGKKGCILLSAHYGGGFFIFDLVRELGGRPQILLRPIKWDYFRPHLSRWAYLKFRVFCVERALQEKVVFTEQTDTKKAIRDKLEQGYHLIIFFDVPPQLTRGEMEKVSLLGKDWYFPRGFLEVLVGTEIPVVPFFSYLTEDDGRVFRFYPPLPVQHSDDIQPVFQQCVRIFESHLVERPEQWFFWEGAPVFWS